MAGHIHGEEVRDATAAEAPPAWQAPHAHPAEMQLDSTKWFDRDVWTRALNSTGYTVTRT